MYAAHAEREQRHPQPTERKQYCDRIRVVEIGDAVLALPQAQADRQADAQLTGFVAITLQPSQQQAVESKQAEADQRMSGGPEAQSGAAGAQCD
ncbi:hypothetical protein D3C77_622020 [compost metagenome]